MDRSSSNHRKLCVKDGDQDRISNLQESVLCHILSLLPTKDAVRTSVLSRTWEYRWTCIYNLSFNDALRYAPGRSKMADFMNFVDRVLTNCRTSSLKKFELLCHRSYDSSRLKTWISAVLRSNIQKLCIIHLGESIELPRCFWDCDSLTELQLCRFSIKLSPLVCFSNIRVLNLSNIQLLIRDSSRNSSQALFSFPVLEVLCLGDCRVLTNVRNFVIDAPLLVSFQMSSRCHETGYDGSDECVIELCGSNLRKFEYGGYSFHKFVLSSPPTVVDASFRHTIYDLNQHLTRSIGFRAYTLLTRFSATVIRLELTGSVVEALPRPIPVFAKLNRLKLSATCLNSKMKVCHALMALLEKAPALESLIFSLEMEGWDEGIEWEPMCSLSHLKVVKFKHFSGRLEELELVKFLLNNASVLEELIIGFHYQGSVKFEITNQLSQFPRVSSNVSMKFKNSRGKYFF